LRSGAQRSSWRATRPCEAPLTTRLSKVVPRLTRDDSNHSLWRLLSGLDRMPTEFWLFAAYLARCASKRSTPESLGTRTRPSQARKATAGFVVTADLPPFDAMLEMTGLGTVVAPSPVSRRPTI